ncbi:Cyanovirin-N [Trichoderma austrokoningii]
MKFSSTLVSLILPMSVHVLGQNFADMCSNITFSAPSTLKADCLDGEGTHVITSTIDLYKCLGNSNGVLQCLANGHFLASCNKCTLQDGTIFACQCRNGKQQVAMSWIDLNDCINNGDGELTC